VHTSCSMGRAFSPSAPSLPPPRQWTIQWVRDATTFGGDNIRRVSYSRRGVWSSRWYWKWWVVNVHKQAYFSRGFFRNVCYSSGRNVEVFESREVLCKRWVIVRRSASFPVFFISVVGWHCFIIKIESELRAQFESVACNTKKLTWRKRQYVMPLQDAKGAGLLVNLRCCVVKELFLLAF